MYYICLYDIYWYQLGDADARKVFFYLCRQSLLSLRILPKKSALSKSFRFINRLQISTYLPINYCHAVRHKYNSKTDKIGWILSYNFSFAFFSCFCSRCCYLFSIAENHTIAHIVCYNGLKCWVNVKWKKEKKKRERQWRYIQFGEKRVCMRERGREKKKRKREIIIKLTHYGRPNVNT